MSDVNSTPADSRRHSLRVAAGRARQAASPPTTTPPPPIPPSLPTSSSQRPPSPSPPHSHRRPPVSGTARRTRRAEAPATNTDGDSDAADRDALGVAVGLRPADREPACTGEATLCPVANCGVLLPSALRDAAGLKHLRRAYVIADVPAKEVAVLELAGCRWCDAPLRTTRTRGGRSSLAAHEVACVANPRRRLRPAPSPTAAGVGRGTASPGVDGRDWAS